MESFITLLALFFLVTAAAVIASLAIYNRKRQQQTLPKVGEEALPTVTAEQPTAAQEPQPSLAEEVEPTVAEETPLTPVEEARPGAIQEAQPLVAEMQPTALAEAELTKAQDAQPIAEEVPWATVQETQETVPDEAQPTIIEEIQTLPADETQVIQFIAAEETQAIATKETEPTTTEQAQPQGTEKVQPKSAEEPEVEVKTGPREPIKRGGRPRGSTPTVERPQTPETKPRHPKPEIVCRKRERQWVLAVEAPEELLESPDLKILQNGSALYELEWGCWRLEHVSGEVVVRWNEAGALQEMKVELGQERYLLFKLVGQDMDQGRLVGSPTSGSYLVIAPDTWERDETLSGPPPVMPEPASVAGYKAHFFDLEKDGDGKIAFRLPGGQPLVIEPKAPRFELFGRQLTDASEHLGPLFGEEPPRIRALDAQTWNKVPTIVVGEEGGGRGRWRTAFSPDPGKTEQDLPSEVAARKGGWYFLRFYDANDDLIESLDFRFVDSLKEIRVPQSPALPSAGGHQPVSVEFLHTSECTVQPTGNLTNIQIERQEERTVLTVPPDPDCDLSRWLVFPGKGPSVEIALLMERIWWAVEEEDKPPSQWRDDPVVLAHEAFAATSSKALWLRLPKRGWVESVLVGFEKHRTRQFHVKVSERAITIPLRDFGDAEELSNIGAASLYVWVTPCQAKVVNVTVKAGCRFCDFSSSHEEVLLSHIESVHLDKLFTSLNWQEMRQHDPMLPAGIYRCSYCDFYVASNDPRNPTSAIINHITDKCPKVPRGQGTIRISFRVINDVSEIREHVIKSLPRIYKCLLCGAQLKEVTSRTRMQHLMNLHEKSLYSLQ